jgi:hypothetical protein
MRRRVGEGGRVWPEVLLVPWGNAISSACDNELIVVNGRALVCSCAGICRWNELVRQPNYLWLRQSKDGCRQVGGLRYYGAFAGDA